MTSNVSGLCQVLFTCVAFTGCIISYTLLVLVWTLFYLQNPSILQYLGRLWHYDRLSICHRANLPSQHKSRLIRPSSLLLFSSSLSFLFFSDRSSVVFCCSSHLFPGSTCCAFRCALLHNLVVTRVTDLLFIS